MERVSSNSGRGSDFSSERGAVHIFGLFFALISIYSTYLLFEQQHRADVLSDYVQYQKKQMDSLELRMQILELRHGKITTVSDSTKS